MALRKSVVALCLLLLLPALELRAETIDVVGLPGAAGTDGAAGDPPEMGGTGEAGGSALSLAGAIGESNTASATGGDGGPGGRGGDALDTSVNAGAGGSGGAGGDALAQAATLGAAQATATATGGNGGAPGASGSGAPPLPVAAPGGAGGAASATATLDSQGSDPAQVTANAVGGSANLGPDGDASAGGDASATASGVSAGSLSISSTARGGGVLAGVGGSAASLASGTSSGDGDVVVQASASGGLPAVIAPSGLPPSTESNASGAASAAAFGQSAGSGSVQVTARAQASPATIVDTSGPVSSAGPLSARAEGHSQDGDVTVTAAVELGRVEGGGQLTELHDAVSGSTAGTLTLRQSLRSISGDMATSLTASNPGGGDLDVQVDLAPWLGELPIFFIPGVQGESANVYLGDIVATSDTGADVSIDVAAVAGSTIAGQSPSNVLQRNADGTPSVIHGASSGGAVTVSAGFLAGRAPSGASQAPGGSVDMVNAVSGETGGDLALRQIAVGGEGADGWPLRTLGGDGGSAHSELTRQAHSHSLQLVSLAAGGRAGPSGPGLFSAGGDASAIADGGNDAGSVELIAGAVGGGSGTGADASVEASAHTSGDGHAVRILLDRAFAPGCFVRVAGIGVCVGSSYLGGARAGTSAGSSTSGLDHIDLPDGGRATSTSVGIAEGDSLVEVHDLAIGGRGGSAPVSGGIPLSVGSTGRGGDASSQASAQGGGVSAVSAYSTAEGGAGGNDVHGLLPGGGFGGDATASASASGLGEVEAVARAQAGSGGNATQVGVGGTALATATASGASGAATAFASTGDSRAFVGASASAGVASPVEVASGAAFGAPVTPLFAGSGREADAFVTADPLAEDVDAARAGNAALPAVFADDPGARVVGVASWDTTASAGDAHSERSIALDITLSDADANRDLLLAAFDFSFLGDGFEQMSFRLEKDGEAFGEEKVFDSVDALLAFFEGTVLDVGSASGGTFSAPALRAVFDVTLGDGDAFGMRVAYVAAVPEPATGVLLGFALVSLAWSRRRGRSASSR